MSSSPREHEAPHKHLNKHAQSHPMSRERRACARHARTHPHSRCAANGRGCLCPINQRPRGFDPKETIREREVDRPTLAVSPAVLR